MTLHMPFLIQAADGDDQIDYAAQEIRQMFTALVRTEGVISQGGLLVTQRGAGANMSVDVAAGHIFITGDSVSNQGRYMCWNDATVNVAVPSAASGSRTHRLVAQLHDKQADLGSAYSWEILLLEDTGTGTPDEPASAVTLALIGPITSSTGSVTDSLISDERPMAGGLPPRNPTFRMTGGTMAVPKGVRTLYVPTFFDPLTNGYSFADHTKAQCVIQVPGKHRFELSGRLNGPSTLDERSNIITRSHAGVELERRTQMHGVGRNATAAVVTASFNCVVGDVIQAWFYDAGGSTNLIAGNNECAFWGEYLGPV